MMQMSQTPVEVRTLIELKTLRLLCFTFLLVPSLIVIASIVVGIMNSGIGWQQHRLPGVFLGVYILTGLVAPLVGVAALIFLYIGKRKHAGDYSSVETKLRRHIYALGVLDLLFIVAGFPMFLVVFFAGVGGSR